MKVSLRGIFFVLLTCAVIAKFYSNYERRARLEQEKALLTQRSIELDDKLSELMPLSYESVTQQFVLQAEKHFERLVRVDAVRYWPKDDYYTLEFTVFDHSTLHSTTIALRRAGGEEYASTILAKFPMTGGKDIPIAVKIRDLR